MQCPACLALQTVFAPDDTRACSSPAPPHAPLAHPQNIARCSRPWKFTWWVLIFQLAVLVAAIACTLAGNCLRSSRWALAHLFTMTTVLGMVIINQTIEDVWIFW